MSRTRPAPFQGRHFADVIIILCVRWYWVNGWRKLPHIDPEVQRLHIASGDDPENF